MNEKNPMNNTHKKESQNNKNFSSRKFVTPRKFEKIAVPKENTIEKKSNFSYISKEDFPKYNALLKKSNIEDSTKCRYAFNSIRDLERKGEKNGGFTKERADRMYAKLKDISENPTLGKKVREIEDSNTVDEVVENIDRNIINSKGNEAKESVEKKNAFETAASNNTLNNKEKAEIVKNGEVILEKKSLNLFENAFNLAKRKLAKSKEFAKKSNPNAFKALKGYLKWTSSGSETTKLVKRGINGAVFGVVIGGLVAGAGGLTLGAITTMGALGALRGLTSGTVAYYAGKWYRNSVEKDKMLEERNYEVIKHRKKEYEEKIKIENLLNEIVGPKISATGRITLLELEKKRDDPNTELTDPEKKLLSTLEQKAKLTLEKMEELKEKYKAKYKLDNDPLYDQIANSQSNSKYHGWKAFGISLAAGLATGSLLSMTGILESFSSLLPNADLGDTGTGAQEGNGTDTPKPGAEQTEKIDAPSEGQGVEQTEKNDVPSEGQGVEKTENFEPPSEAEPNIPIPRSFLERITDAFIQKGDGVSNAFMRQIENSVELKEHFNLPDNPTQDQLMRTAGQLVKDTGYFDSLADQTLVKEGHGVAYLLGFDDAGKVIVSEISTGLQAEELANLSEAEVEELIKTKTIETHTSGVDTDLERGSDLEDYERNGSTERNGGTGGTGGDGVKGGAPMSDKAVDEWFRNDGGTGGTGDNGGTVDDRTVQKELDELFGKDSNSSGQENVPFEETLTSLALEPVRLLPDGFGKELSGKLIKGINIPTDLVELIEKSGKTKMDILLANQDKFLNALNLSLNVDAIGKINADSPFLLAKGVPLSFADLYTHLKTDGLDEFASGLETEVGPNIDSNIYSSVELRSSVGLDFVTPSGYEFAGHKIPVAFAGFLAENDISVKAFVENIDEILKKLGVEIPRQGMEGIILEGMPFVVDNRLSSFPDFYSHVETDVLKEAVDSSIAEASAKASIADEVQGIVDSTKQNVVPQDQITVNDKQ